MLKIERRFWDWIGKHWDAVIILAATVFSVLIRYSMRGFMTNDMQDCLLPWYEEIRAGGGLASLGRPVGNYNIPYQTLIALFTYLPWKAQYLYKLLSCVFDLLQAILISRMVLRAGHSRIRAAAAYCAALNLPIVVFNSAMWGQCDAIFTFFCLLAVDRLWQGKNVRSFLALGAAFAFKLQAVFVLPFFLFMYVKRRSFSLLQFLWIPLMMLALSVGGLVQGVSIPDVFGIYLSQTTYFTKMSLGYPGFWNFLVQTEDFSVYLNLYRYATLLTILVLMVMMVFLLRSKKEWSGTDFFRVVFLMSYTCVYFLPSMHERYSYVYMMLGLFLCFLDPRSLPVYLAMLAIDLSSYSSYLFYLNPAFSWRDLALMNGACYVLCCHRTLRSFQHKGTVLLC